MKTVCIACGHSCNIVNLFAEDKSKIFCTKRCAKNYKFSREHLYVGRLKNGINDALFNPTLTHDGAYILGFFWNSSRKIFFKKIIKPYGDRHVLQDVSRLLSGFSRASNSFNGNRAFLKAPPAEFVDIIKSYNLENEKKKIPKHLFNSFICGTLDATGTVICIKNTLKVKFESDSSLLLENISDIFNTDDGPVKKTLTIEGNAALEMCYLLYKNVNIRSSRNYKRYIDCLNFSKTENTESRPSLFYYKKLRADAIPPYKERVTDSGYDVSAVDLSAHDKDIYIADMKLAIAPEEGWYFDLVGRSSLPSKGWQFMGGVGIIDRSYTGPLKMFLKKIDDRPLPELPFRCGQLIPRPILHADFVEVCELDGGSRGAGGFGSTD